MDSRALSESEVGLVRWLLRRDFPGVEVLRNQVPYATVSGTWEPGAASLHLEVEPTAERSCFQDGLVPGQVWAYGSNNEPLGTVLLWVRDGALSGIEYGWVTEVPPTALPALTKLRDLDSGEQGA